MLISCLVFGTAACGGTDEPAPINEPSTTASRGTTAGTTPGSTPGTTPGTTVVDEEAAVLETVEHYWETWLAANNPPNPDHPDLAKYATGPNLEQLRSSIADNKVKGIALRLPDPSITSHDYSVVRINADTAVVTDCLQDDGLQVESATGAIVDDTVTTRLLQTTLVRESGAWKVRENKEMQKWPGAVDCA